MFVGAPSASLVGSRNTFSTLGRPWAVAQSAFPLVDWSVGGTRNRTGSHHLEVRLRRKAPKKSGGGTRGSRGHGWYLKYREGRGGRHLQGRWNVDVAEMEKWNDKIMEMSLALKKNEQATAHFDLKWDGSGEQATTTEEGGEEEQGGRVHVDLADGLLPLTCGNFVGRLNALDLGCVERVEKGVGVLFSVTDSVAEGVGRELRREVGLVGRKDFLHDEALEEAEYEHLSSIHNVVDKDNNPLDSFSQDATQFRDGEAMLMSFAPKGVVGMVRETKAGTSTTKFLITTEDGGAKHLQGTGVAFGRVKKGDMKLVKKIMEEFTMRGRPANRISIVSGGTK
ncbi:hypothetical protein TrVE_jg9272 [Triparma verrucosa]|nr:hypothetical protein TrVE_jg9272 [Triparma verrucosa]